VSCRTQAIDLRDESRARVEARQTLVPEEITEVQKRRKFIVHRMATAMENMSSKRPVLLRTKRRKERETMRALREKYHLDESSNRVWPVKDMREVVSRMDRMCPSPP